MTSESDRRTIRLILEYDGTRFVGWQLQPGELTVQGVLEGALEAILGAHHRVHGAGRTDSGVHARGQVAHFYTHHAMDEATLWRALNARLPRDVAVRGLEQVDPSFHSRFTPHMKQYRYTIWNHPHRTVFLERHAWHIKSPLDWGAIESSLTLLEGTHDFAAFRASDCGAKTTIRTLSRAVHESEGDRHVVTFEGNGFLKHMIRIVMGTLVDVGLGRRTALEFGEILAGGDRRRAGRTAPPQGLCLQWIDYERGFDWMSEAHEEGEVGE